MEELKKADKVCSCFGNNNVKITDELRARVDMEIDKAISDGVGIFLFGGSSEFDSLVYDLVSLKIQKRPDLGLKRVFCFPLLRSMKKPSKWFAERECEAYGYPENSLMFQYMSLYYRDRTMIDESDLILFYVNDLENCGIYITYKYALKSRKKVINFAT